MAEKSLDAQTTINLLGIPMAAVLEETQVGRSYLRVFNPADHATTYYEVQTGRNADGGLSILMPFSHVDNLPLCYFTQQPFPEGRTDISIVISGERDRDDVVMKVVGMLCESPNVFNVDLKCTRYGYPDSDSWRVIVTPKNVYAKEIMSLLDRESAMKDGTIRDVDAFLRHETPQ